MPIIRRSDRNRNEQATSPGLESFSIVDATHGSDSLRMGELTIDSMSRVPRHTHTNTEEAMVLLEGSLEAMVGSQRVNDRSWRSGAGACGNGAWIRQPLGHASPVAVRVPEARPRPGLDDSARRSAVGIPVGAGAFGLQLSPRPSPGKRVLKT